MRIAVVGVGTVGAQVVRMLAQSPGVSSIPLIGSGTWGRGKDLDTSGSKIEVIPQRRGDTDVGVLGSLGADVVVLCSPDETQVALAQQALDAGAHVVTTADSTESIQALFGLEDYSAEIGRSVVVGAAASPGLTSVLARHGAALFDEVEEISVAVVGAGGPACVDRRVRAARTDTQEWRDGVWLDTPARSGPDLVWFPDPLGVEQCERGDVSDAVLLQRLLPDVALISSRLGRSSVRQRDRAMARLRRDRFEEQGGVRVTVSGRRDGGPETVIYAAVSRLSFITAAMATTTAVRLAEAPTPGARSVAELTPPVAALSALHEVGLDCMVYEPAD